MATSTRTPPGGVTVASMAPNAFTAPSDRVAERRRAVALARHYREAEGLSIAQIADRLGRSPATVKAYFYDPTGEKARSVKARYHGMCRGCGADTQARNGKGDAYAYCKACHPGATARRWTRQRVLDAMRAWHARHGRLPSSYDWSRTHARRRGGQALERLAEAEWPAASVVANLFETWAAARAAALREGRGDSDTSDVTPRDPKGQGGWPTALPSAAMLPLGLRFGVDAVILDGTAHTSGCPLSPPMLPPGATRRAAGETYWAPRCPRECGCAPPVETLLSYKPEPAARLSVC